MLNRLHQCLRLRPRWQWQLLAHLLALSLLAKLLLGLPAAADGIAMLLNGSGLLALYSGALLSAVVTATALGATVWVARAN